MFDQLPRGLSIFRSPGNHSLHQVQEHLFIFPFKTFLQIFKTGRMNLTVLNYPIFCVRELVDASHSKGRKPTYRLYQNTWH